MLLSMLLGYLPWYNFSAVLKFIAKEYSLDASQTGAIIAAFQAGYVVVVIFTGWLADKIGTKKVVAGATLLAGIFSLLFPFVANGFTSILVMRLLTGAACGAIYAPGMSLLANWFPPERRGSALGAYTGALVAAYAGSYFIAGPIAAQSGWRAGIIATSLPVFIAFFIIVFLIQEKPKEAALQYDGAMPAPQGGWGGPGLLTGSYMGHMWELYAFWGWVGPFMVSAATQSGLAPDVAVATGSRLAAIIILIGAVASWAWGHVADKIGRTKAISIAAVCSLSANLFFGYLYGHSLWLIVGVGLWIGFWVIADSAIYKAGLVDMVSPKVRTLTLGLQSAIGFSMTILAPLIFGKIVQHYNGTVNPVEAKVWGPAFLILGVGAIISPILAITLRSHRQAVLMCGGKR